MVKNLRSLIHEKIPEELRIEIELLSLRRDLVNKEKHEELLEMLRKYDIKDVIPLGPGTNRYAFKLNGFVVKVATDHDGKIDNFKEFKMAKRLYPYVTKIYEVSENGTLLVAEYIQPFSSYTEMCRYAGQIREILTRLSSVYLIGDVGITSKNYSNWGLRIGTEDPVCLDFAYVYEVSSELFICRNCKTNSMLVPNNDFTELYCPNKACGQRYHFEDIRARIGNDVHKHEIGDLSEEGYRLIESNRQTELDENRSNYLARKKKKEKQENVTEEQEIEYEPFVMEHEPQYYIDNKEDLIMSNNYGISDKVAKDMMNSVSDGFKFSNGDIIQATVISSTDGDDIIASKVYELPPDVIETEVVQQPNIKNDRREIDSEWDDGFDNIEESFPEDDYDESTLAFSGEIDPMAAEKYISHEQERPSEVISHQKIPAQYLKEYDDDELYIPNKLNIQNVNSVQHRKPEPTIQLKLSAAINDYPESIDKDFIDNAVTAFSKLSNKIGNHMHNIDLYNVARIYIKDKRYYADSFYKAIQNAVFRSLMAFCNFEEVDVPNYNDNGTHKEFTCPETIEGMPYENTMIFVYRFWKEKEINSQRKPDDVMMVYRDLFNDHRGIQREWLSILETRLSWKIPIDRSCAKRLANIIADNWCVSDDEDETPDIIPSVESNESHHIDVAQNPADEEDEYDDEYYDEDSPERRPFRVDIYDDETFDIIKVTAGDAFGETSIPFYTKLSDIEIDQTPNALSVADDRNGVWDWLVHMVPDMMFYTTDPDRWMVGSQEIDSNNPLHIVILSENNGEFIMGMYYLDGIFMIDDDDVAHPVEDIEILAKINKLIRDDIGYGSISHLRRSLSMEDLIRDEAYIDDLVRSVKESIESYDSDEEEEEYTEDSEEFNTDLSDNERTALMAIMGDTGIDDSSLPDIQEEQQHEVVPDENIPQENSEPEEFVSDPVKPAVEPVVEQQDDDQVAAFAPIRRRNR